MHQLLVCRIENNWIFFSFFEFKTVNITSVSAHVNGNNQYNVNDTSILK